MKLPRLKEVEVAQQVDDWLRLEGWFVVETAAEHVKRGSGRPGGIARGHADRVYLRPCGKSCEAFFAELKREKARTKPGHKLNQQLWQQAREQDGFLCYRAPDGCADPFGHFVQWYSAIFPRRAMCVSSANTEDE